jgi:hypothetical protein
MIAQVRRAGIVDTFQRQRVAEAEEVSVVAEGELRCTGTGPTRLVDWLPQPAPAPGPVLVETPPRPSGRPWVLPRPWTWVESLILAAYSLVVALGIAWHEPWADETQAYLMARDNGWWRLMFHEIRYEGSPGLWHSFLWVLTRLHLGIAGMHWISGIVAAAGIYVLLRYSPFPLILRALLPLGFWLAYQDSVIARSYVLYAVMAFAVAAILRRGSQQQLTRKSLIAVAVLLGLIANISLHGFVVSFGFAIVAGILARRQSQRGLPVRIALPLGILCFFWLFAVATAAPPADVDFPAGRHLQMVTFKVWARFGDRQAKQELIDLQTHDYTRPGELPMHQIHPFQPSKGEAFWRKIARVLGLFTFPITNFGIFGLLVCGLVIAQAIVWHRPRGQTRDPIQIGWIGLIPWLIMILVFSRMYLAPRHAGMLWETLVACLWLTWPATQRNRNRNVLWLRRATLAALVLACLNQLQWTGHALWSDMHQPYAGDQAMASWLKTLGPGKRVAGFGYHSIGVTGWFHHPLYFNQPTTWWTWSQKPRIDARAPFAIAIHPDVIIFGGWNWSDHDADVSEDWVKPDLTTLNKIPLNDDFAIIPYARKHGYRVTHRFCGHGFLRSGYAEEYCQVALQPVATVTQESASSAHSHDPTGE